MATNLTNNVISSIKIQDKEYKLKATPFHGTTTEWENSNYIPKQGEIIIYDAETATDEAAKIKIGDGSTLACNLPFVNKEVLDQSKVTLETWNDSNGSTSQDLKELVINKVASKAIYEEMEASGKIDTNELYLIEDDGETIQADWNQSDETQADFIKNKPENLAFIDVTSNETITIPSDSSGTGGSLGSYATSLLIKVLRNAVYNTDQSGYVDELEAALYGSTIPNLPDTPDTPDDSDYTIIPLTAVKGAVTRVDGSKITYDTTSSSAAIRATVNPIAFYVESGKTYKISLSNYSTYSINLQTYAYSVKDTDFTVTAGTQRIINGDFTRLATSGWKRENIVYTADGTADIITIMIAKGSANNEEFTDEDIAALNIMLTVKTNADISDEPVLPDTPDTPDNPVNPDAEIIPLSVVHGTSARVDGQKLTYDPTQTIRGATNPLAFYVEEGKTYTVSLSSYENYGFYPQGLSYSTSGTDFTVVDGTEKIFHGDFTRTLAPGWQYADYTFTADGTYQVIALQFRNIANTALTADDITALNGLLTVTVE